MKNQRWRDEFIYQATLAGLKVSDARALLSKAATLQRLSEAECNGDYPADGGSDRWQTAVCSRCEGLWSPSAIKSKGCPECRTEDAVRAILEPYRAKGHGAEILESQGMIYPVPIFRGDPRGCVLKIKTAEGREIGVPS